MVRLLIATLLVMTIVISMTGGGCPNPYEGTFGLKLAEYYKNYANWSWDERYQKAKQIEGYAVLADIEFSWLDLPVEKIELTTGRK